MQLPYALVRPSFFFKKKKKRYGVGIGEGECEFSVIRSVKTKSATRTTNIIRIRYGARIGAPKFRIVLDI